MNNILMIGAHYDDVELGCGGTAAKLAAEGKNVYKITLTNNETNFEHFGIRVSNDDSKRSSNEACKILGITEIDFDPEPCNFLKYSTDIMQRKKKIIYDYKIDTVFIHYDSDMNRDHIEANKICQTAARHCDNILAFQSNTYIIAKSFYPSFFIDISDYVDLKIEALSKYGVEHNRFGGLFEANINRNKVWGYGNMVKCAEGFVVIKMLIK